MAEVARYGLTESSLVMGKHSGRAALKDALGVLNPRERRIFEARRLADDPITLEELATRYNVSRERIRQIEVRAFEKLQERMRRMAGERGMETGEA